MPSLIAKRLRDRLPPSLNYLITSRMNCRPSVVCAVERLGLLWQIFEWIFFSLLLYLVLKTAVRRERTKKSCRHLDDTW